jgi:hypothetical protein
MLPNKSQNQEAAIGFCPAQGGFVLSFCTK